MLNFCTLFNSKYYAKGVAMHQSLTKVCAAFHLYIFAFDDACYQLLTDNPLANTTIIPLCDFENDDLLKVKPGRSVAEYCWTSTPYTVKYCLEKFNLPECTYLDADLFFYKDPSGLIADMGDNSVLITPHRYYKDYDVSATAGIYCVQFVTFKNNTAGNAALNWWANACLKWCYARYEDGKMGDQKYLDSWPFMFDGVYICKNKYAGAAPWNAITYQPDDAANIIFYHYHDLKYLSNGSWYLGGYEIPKIILDDFYKPYAVLLKSIAQTTEGIDTLNIIDADKFSILTTKYKVGIYILDIKTAFRNFIMALFFTKRRRHYQNNFIN
jgi:hypothetical protein